MYVKLEGLSEILRLRRSLSLTKYLQLKTDDPAVATENLVWSYENSNVPAIAGLLSFWNENKVVRIVVDGEVVENSM
jgi:uncharacterized protein (DUF427 family)